MWFTDLLEAEAPGKRELMMFVEDVNNFLSDVLRDNNNFGFLWETDTALQNLALQTYQSDIVETSIPELLDAIDGIDEQVINQHGLQGSPLRFKFSVLNSIANQRESLSDALSIRGWFKKVIDAIDVVLNSLIQATGGVGGLVKEFKDALRSLA